jgi:hypothetical protein
VAVGGDILGRAAAVVSAVSKHTTPDRKFRSARCLRLRVLNHAGRVASGVREILLRQRFQSARGDSDAGLDIIVRTERAVVRVSCRGR